MTLLCDLTFVSQKWTPWLSNTNIYLSMICICVKAEYKRQQEHLPSVLVNDLPRM